MDTNIPLYCIVIPIYNEEDTIIELYNRLAATLKEMNDEYEIIFVDDGSSDSSLQIILSLRKKDDRIKCVSLTRNFGHQIAISSGIYYSNSRATVVMDGDLQDPPEVIPILAEKWKDGYDVVYAIRRKRKENIIKRAFYKMFYQILRRLSYLDIPLDSGDFSIMDRKVVDILNSMPEKNRFVRGIRTWIGFRQTGQEYERGSRFAGSSKYPLSKLMKLALDGIFSFSIRPLKLAATAGFFISFLSFTGGVYYLLHWLFQGGAPQGFTTLAILVLFLAGVQLVVFGIMGEYIGRIHEEVKNRPMFLVSQLIGLTSRKK